MDRNHEKIIFGIEEPDVTEFYVKDQQTLGIRRIWDQPGRFMRGGIRALALKIGDIIKAEELVEGNRKSSTRK